MLRRLTFAPLDKGLTDMPSRSELPGTLSRDKFLNALERCGFTINRAGGKGDHYKVIWPKTGKSVTVTNDLRRDVLYYLVKQLESISEVSWEDIKKEL